MLGPLLLPFAAVEDPERAGADDSSGNFHPQAIAACESPAPVSMISQEPSLDVFVSFILTCCEYRSVRLVAGVRAY